MTDKATMPEVADAPYYVAEDRKGCEHCGAEKTWFVVYRPLDRAESISYEEKDQADEMAEMMNDAFALGSDKYDSLAAVAGMMAEAAQNAVPFIGYLPMDAEAIRAPLEESIDAYKALMKGNRP